MKNDHILAIDNLPHKYQIGATVLLSGSIAAFAYGISQAGFAELASTFLSFYIIFVVTRTFSKIASTRSKHFKETSQIFRTMNLEFQRWMNDRKILALCLIGLPVTLAYTAFKALTEFVLGAFSNVWIATGFGLLLAAIVCSPILFKSMGQLITTNGDNHED